jgi:hypothetical protein
MAQIRGVFPLPFTSPQNTGNPNILELVPGGIYALPSGTYLISTGSQTIIQWWDPTNAIWRDYAGPETVNQVSCDGTNYRLINLSGVFVGANITNPGSGGTNGIGPIQTGTTVSFTAPAAGGVTATAQGYVVVGGNVPAPTVTQGGSGFLVPPVIACDPPPAGGVQATFAATISAAGVLTGVAVVNPGAGYTSIPQFYIIPQPMFYQGAIRFPGDTPQPYPPPPGLINPANLWTGSPFQNNIGLGTTGALLTGNALINSGQLTAIVMTYFGQGYTAAISAAAAFAGTSLGAAAATAIGSFCVAVTPTTTTAGAGYVIGTGAETTTGFVAGVNDNNTFFPRPARGLITSVAGAFSVADPGFGIQSNTGFTLIGGTTAAAFTASNLGGINDTSIVQAMVQ